MTPSRFPVLPLALVAMLATVTAVQSQPLTNSAPWDPASSPALQSLVDDAVKAALTRFADQQLKSDDLAVTVVDLADPARPVQAGHRGATPIYPASVVKLFYLAAAHHWMEQGRLADTPELRRAMSDMIVHSYNEATHYVIDLLTGTTSGPELPEADLREWFEKRNAVNRHFAALGYANINANKKPWCEGPYGRETQAIKAFQPTRNMLTTDATARLMSEIALGRAVTAARSAEMMKLLARDPADQKDTQAQFTGPALPKGAKLWSKAGWTSQTRHDAVYFELPNGAKGVLVIFTVSHASNREIIPAIAGKVLAGWPAKTEK